MIKCAPFLFFFTFAAGCDPYVAESGPSSQSKIVRETKSGSAAEFTNAGLLRAAFLLLDGKSRSDAIAFLKEDGFDCFKLRCKAVVVTHELFKAGIRSPGPLKTFTDVYEITVGAPTVRSPSDLQTSLSTTVAFAGE
jgi:hypothetical protein